MSSFSGKVSNMGIPLVKKTQFLSLLPVSSPFTHYQSWLSNLVAYLVGLPEQEEHRVAPVFSSAPYDPVSATMGQLLNTREVHVAEIPSANGIGNARSLAKM